jgi:hypothetical protein
MQEFVTPQPGQTAYECTIIDKPDYKLMVRLSRQHDQIRYQLLTWTPEHAWVNKEYYLADGEYYLLYRGMAPMLRPWLQA